MLSGLKIEKGAAALALMPERERNLVRALGLVHDAWTTTITALSEGNGDAELDMTIMSAATDLWRAMKRINSAQEALEMDRMLSSGEGPETEDISAARGDLEEMAQIGECLRQQRANFNAIADGRAVPYPSEY